MKFNCDHCNQKIESARTLAGSIMVCPSCAMAFRVPEYGLTPGDRLDGFILRKRIGTGGMGDVWLAEQESMQRECAVKILSPELTIHQEFINRFMQEVKSSGKLQHANIVTTYYAGEADGMYYLAMECISGETLDAILHEKGRIDEDTVLKIARSTAEALSYAWEDLKLIHRDLKPSNIMIDDAKTVKILDFGIAKSLDGSNTSHLTQTGAILGTPYYMSPEQASRKSALDCRSDIYSLGAVLYHLLTGEPPFQGDTPVGILAQHLSGHTVPIRKVVPNLSPQTAAMIEKMMQKDPSRRFQTWAEVIKEIDKIKRKKKAVSIKYIIPVGVVALTLSIVLFFVLSNYKNSHISSSTQPIIDEVPGNFDQSDDGKADSSPSAAVKNPQKPSTGSEIPASNPIIKTTQPALKLPEPKLETQQPRQRGNESANNITARLPEPDFERQPSPGIIATRLKTALGKSGISNEKIYSIMEICGKNAKNAHKFMRDKMEGNIDARELRDKLFNSTKNTQFEVKKILTPAEFEKFKKAFKSYQEDVRQNLRSRRGPGGRLRRPDWQN